MRREALPLAEGAAGEHEADGIEHAPLQRMQLRGYVRSHPHQRGAKLLREAVREEVRIEVLALRLQLLAERFGELCHAHDRLGAVRSPLARPPLRRREALPHLFEHPGDERKEWVRRRVAASDAATAIAVRGAGRERRVVDRWAE